MGTVPTGRRTRAPAHRRGPCPPHEPSGRTPPPRGHRRAVRRPGRGDGARTARLSRSQPRPVLRPSPPPTPKSCHFPSPKPASAPGNSAPQEPRTWNRSSTGAPAPCVMAPRCDPESGAWSSPEKVLTRSSSPASTKAPCTKTGPSNSSSAGSTSSAMLRDEAVAVFRAYGERTDAVIYNARGAVAPPTPSRARRRTPWVQRESVAFIPPAGRGAAPSRQRHRGRQGAGRCCPATQSRRASCRHPLAQCTFFSPSTGLHTGSHNFSG